MKSIEQWCADIHKLATEKGWWDTDRKFPEVVALIHSEISEAFEEWRLGWDSAEFSVLPGKPCGLSIELADAVIRIMDYCEHVGIDLEEAIRIKHEYNKTRLYRHGDKQA